ncbi:MAG: hypothetical protein FWF84_01655 [Kiritimatiellaeota bacterium]|nr:hypothetical protein [Kiritimatiellota bacterium]
MDAVVALVKFVMLLVVVLAVVALAIPLLVLNLVFKGFLAGFLRRLAKFYLWCNRRRTAPSGMPRGDAVIVSAPPYSRKGSENVTLRRE